MSLGFRASKPLSRKSVIEPSSHPTSTTVSWIVMDSLVELMGSSFRRFGCQDVSYVLLHGVEPRLLMRQQI
jgi:hypothetical protein